MSLFHSSVRPTAVLSDEAVERYLAAVRAHVDPDPAFRRRLRGVVLSHYVATREAGRAGPLPRAMGRLGRSVLYASFALGVSVTGVMAASEIAVPGDVLYPLKRAIEDVRLEILPAQFENELVIYELNERFSELAVLVERQDEARVEALATEVATEYASVISEVTRDGEPLSRRTEALALLIAQLPDEARVAMDRASTEPGAFTDPGDSAEPADGETPGGEEPAPNPDPAAGGAGSGDGQGTGNGVGTGNGAGSGNGSGSGGSGGQGNGAGAGGNGTGNAGGGAGDDTDEVDEPTATPEPSPTAKPKKSPKP